VLVALGLTPVGPAWGSPATYLGSDPGVGPGQDAPVTTGALTQFRTAIGASPSITFENLPLGHFDSLEVVPGVTASLSNTDATPAPGFHYGIASDNQDAMVGYNVTPGGGQFLRFAPTLDVGAASVRFDFARPIVSFGFFVTGLGIASGPLHVTYGTGTGQEQILDGDPAGGILFFGISGLTTPTSQVTLQLRSVQGTSRDVFGIDDFRFQPASDPVVNTPEPATILLAGLGLPMLMAALRRRRAS
jgi:hypothetical protein